MTKNEMVEMLMGFEHEIAQTLLGRGEDEEDLLKAMLSAIRVAIN